MVKLKQHALDFLIYFSMSAMTSIGFELISRFGFGFSYKLSALIATSILIASALVILKSSLRNKWLGGITIIIISSGILILGNSLKIATLRIPISTNDLQALPTFWGVIFESHAKRYAYLIAVILLVLVMALVTFKVKWVTLISTSILILYIAIITVIVNYDQSFIESILPVAMKKKTMFDGTELEIQEPLEMIKSQGPILYLIKTWGEGNLRQKSNPTHEQISQIPLQRWQPHPVTHQRNIHIVLLESIWDIELLDNIKTDKNPLDPRFVSLWEKAKKTYALSPVFGGGTANAEFEVLCGLPAPDDNSIIFVGKIRSTSTCLPRVLNYYGYNSLASHAHEASNWNRDHAYDALGFNSFYPINSFNLDDMEGPYLFDGSFFKQNLEYLSVIKSSNHPVLNYQVTLSSHWAYTRNTQDRPDKIQVLNSKNQMLQRYVNAVFYTTSSFIDWVEKILDGDPNAIIISFGDHAPIIQSKEQDLFDEDGKNESLTFDNPKTKTLLNMSRTPLLIIDGKKGPVNIGKNTPLYSIPHIISNLLGEGDLLPQSAQEGGLTIRPFLDHLLVGTQNKWYDCSIHDSNAEAAICEQARTYVHTSDLLRNDIMFGNGFYLKSVDATYFLKTAWSAPMKINKRIEPCQFEVKDWGPKEGEIGDGFNVQPDGSSAIWVAASKLSGHPILRVSDIEGRSVFNFKDNIVTSSFRRDEILSRKGDLSVTVQCENNNEATLGKIVMKAGKSLSSP